VFVSFEHICWLSRLSMYKRNTLKSAFFEEGGLRNVITSYVNTTVYQACHTSAVSVLLAQRS